MSHPKFSAVATILIILAGTIYLTQTLAISNTCQTITSNGRIVYQSWEKLITWGDGSIEKLNIDNFGQIYLNETKTIAFGLHIATHPLVAYNSTNKILTTLQNNNVRFMALDISNWFSAFEMQNWINYWMPLLYKYKMWVLLNIQEPVNPAILNISEQFERIASIIDKVKNENWANMIFAVGYSWELDNFGYTDAQVTTYLSGLYPLVKEKIDSSLIGKVPIVAKNMQSASNYGTTAIVHYSDVPNYDFYITTDNNWYQYNNGTWINMTGDWQSCFASNIENFYYQTLPDAGKSGFKIWYAEAGLYPTDEMNLVNPYSYNFTIAHFQSYLDNMGYANTSAIFLWVMTWDSNYMYTAFDNNGNPYPWFEDILNYYSTL